MSDKRKYALPTQNDVRPVNPVLTNMSIGYKNPEFIWDLLSPVVPTDEKSGTYFIWTRDFWFRAHEEAGGAKRATSGAYRRVDLGVSTATFKTIEYGYETGTDDPTQASSQTPESLIEQDVKFLTNLIEMELELLIAAELFVTGKWGTSNTLTGTSQWSDFANSDPIGDFDTAKGTVRKATGVEPDRAVMGIETWNDLKEHPLITDKYKHTQAGIMTEELVAAALGIKEIVVGRTAKNTAKEGQTYVGADVWTDSCVLIPAIDAPALESPAGAYTFMWDEVGNIPWAIQQYREEQTRTEISRVLTHVIPKITSAPSGYMFLDTAA